MSNHAHIRPAPAASAHDERRTNTSVRALPAWAAPAALGAILVLAAVLYGWALGSLGWGNSYYSAAVKSMGKKWTNLLLGSFDPAGVVTVDKSPAALWPQVISSKIFGMHGWALILPQVLEGVAGVLVLHRTVRRWAGEGAALIAALVLTLTPITVAINRDNNPDTLLVLLLVLLLVSVAYALTRALQAEGRAATWWLCASGFLIGCGFLTKMLERGGGHPRLALVRHVLRRPDLDPHPVRLHAGHGLRPGPVRSTRAGPPRRGAPARRGRGGPRTRTRHVRPDRPRPRTRPTGPGDARRRLPTGQPHRRAGRSTPGRRQGTRRPRRGPHDRLPEREYPRRTPPHGHAAARLRRQGNRAHPPAHPRRSPAADRQQRHRGDPDRRAPDRHWHDRPTHPLPHGPGSPHQRTQARPRSPRRGTPVARRPLLHRHRHQHGAHPPGRSPAQLPSGPDRPARARRAAPRHLHRRAHTGGRIQGRTEGSVPARLFSGIPCVRVLRRAGDRRRRSRCTRGRAARSR